MSIIIIIILYIIIIIDGICWGWLVVHGLRLGSDGFVLLQCYCYLLLFV